MTWSINSPAGEWGPHPMDAPMEDLIRVIPIKWCLTHGSGLDKLDYPACDFNTGPADGQCRMVEATLHIAF